MKKCHKCGKLKSFEYFYKANVNSDGYMCKCKECTKKDARENRAKKNDYYREYEKSRAMLPHRIKARLNYQKTPEGKESVKSAKEKWKSENLIKQSATTMLGNAVRDGRVIKPKECEDCGSGNKRIHGHHDNYDYPLQVRWLCPSCHKKWHDENGSGING